MPIFQGLGRALRWLRDRQAKRQYQVADSAGITKAMLSAYETGKQKPSLETLEKILAALDGDLNDLHNALQIVNERPEAIRRPGAPLRGPWAGVYRRDRDNEDGGESVVDLHRMLGGVITRIPVLGHDDVPVCVIHQSLLYKFLADRSIEALKTKQPFDAEHYTLADLLAAPRMKELVQDSLAYVPEGALLADAKERMERTPNCQDVFVTEHGQPGEPVLGWLTDAELRRAARV
jgi:transcriptional regulator with XRE-family HTH domain